MRRKLTSAVGPALLVLLLALGVAPAAHALTSIGVGRISSEKACTLYRQSAGRAGIVATPHGFAAGASWRTWFVRDCVDNFASIRTSLESALAASGKFAVSGTGRYVVSGRMSAAGAERSSYADRSEADGGYAVSSEAIFVNMDVNLRDASGRMIYGGLISKRLDTGASEGTESFQSSQSQTGEGVYTRLQQQIALAAARLIAFRLVPLTVTGGDGRQLQLNYGSPLLTLGTIVQATSPDGATTIRYNVTSASSQAATAEIDGDGDASRVVPGSSAVVIEADDPAANGRRLRRVDLP